VRNRRFLAIALIGDHDPEVTAHRAVPKALSLAAEAAGLDVRPNWIHTTAVPDPIGDHFSAYDAVWCVPASPYASFGGALRAIRYARESGTPFFGTCGGFQHAVIEYARNLLGSADAGHAEIHPDAANPVITPLSCALVECSGSIRLVAGSRAAALYGDRELREQYHCSYGLNPKYETAMERSGLRISGRDPAGEARIVELEGHPFYLATLFQPERAALRGECHPLVGALVAEAARFAERRRVIIGAPS
jgi:CTP synthase (UTP-ammonia lyase)